MKKFLFIYRSPVDGPTPSPEEMQQNMQAWMDWIGGAMQAGWMVSPGDALLPDSGKLVGGDTVTDGPFVESKEIVGGYSIVQAASLDAAAALTANCPALGNGGRVEVRELMNVAVP